LTIRMIADPAILADLVAPAAAATSERTRPASAAS
jgi:hypothetical protein